MPGMTASRVLLSPTEQEKSITYSLCCYRVVIRINYSFNFYADGMIPYPLLIITPISKMCLWRITSSARTSNRREPSAL